MRANMFITSVMAERQYFGMPEKDKPTTPFTIMYRVGGSPDHMGQDYPQLIIEAWGGTKHEAESLALVLAREINGIRPVQVGSAWMLAGHVNVGPVETSGTPDAKRYRIDATFHIRSSV